MFARGVEVLAKSGMALEVVCTIRERALPILRKQPGFVDEIVLVSDTQVSYKSSCENHCRVCGGCPERLAGATGLEPAASCVTGQQRCATYWISTVLTARS